MSIEEEAKTSFSISACKHSLKGEKDILEPYGANIELRNNSKMKLD